jgi:hypothetical protein
MFPNGATIGTIGIIIPDHQEKTRKVLKPVIINV